MDIRNIQTFIRVAELKSFTKAAKENSYAQSTVTFQIQQLERELGYPLFDRIGKSVSLTALGQAFLSHAYEIVHILDKASALDKQAQYTHGTLRVGILESLLHAVVLDLLPEFKAQFPNLELQLKMGQATELLQQLKENQLDMVYISTMPDADPELRCCYRREERLIFVCHPEHALAKRKKVPIEELLSFDFVVTERSGICHGRLRKLAAENDAQLHDLVEVDSTVAIARLIQMGMGLAFLPEYSVHQQLQAGTLRRVDVDLEPQIYYSQILFHQKRWQSPFLTGFIETIRRVRPE